MSAPQFHAPPEWWKMLKPLARQMRQVPTPAEEHLWQCIRARKLGFKFRRQHAIERFIVDFICFEQQLIVEVDGSIHDEQKEYDAIRQAFLEASGFRVLRFTNEDVLYSTDVVLTQIRRAGLT
jgi:very-short-patch-repair endonuclease